MFPHTDIEHTQLGNRNVMKGHIVLLFLIIVRHPMNYVSLAWRWFCREANSQTCTSHFGRAEVVIFLVSRQNKCNICVKKSSGSNEAREAVTKKYAGHENTIREITGSATCLDAWLMSQGQLENGVRPFLSALSWGFFTSRRLHHACKNTRHRNNASSVARI